MVISWEVGLLLTLCFVAGLLTAALLLTGWWRGRQAARAAELARTFGPVLQSWVERSLSQPELDRLKGLSRFDRRGLMRMCIRLLPSLDRDGADRVRETLRRSGLLEHEVARLRHRSPAERADACTIVGRLGQTDAVAPLVQRLRDQDLGVRRQAIGALADLQAVEELGAVVEAIETAGDWGNLLAVMALVRMGPSSVSRIGALLEGSKSPAMTKALLQVTGRLGIADNPAAVRTLAMHPDPEIRIEALRTLGAIAPDPESVSPCLAAMDDAEWPARALAAWSLGRLRDELAIPRLERAMGDPAYWVRHHAAQAIAGLGEAGEAALRRCLSHVNPFVRDMAAQALYMLSVPEAGAA